MEQRVLRSIDDQRSIAHEGVLERSGRYPWGSGDRPYQRLKDWQSYISKMRRSGVTDENIAKTVGMTVEELHDSLMSTSQKRNIETIRRAEATVANVAEVWRLKEKGWSNTAIAEKMGVTEGTVRNWMKPGADARAKQITNISDALRDAVDSKGCVDVGAAVERYLGVPKSRMDACVELLKEEGYNVYWVKQRQAGTGLYTTIKALVPPGTDYKEFKAKFDEDPSIVQPIGFYGEDGGNVIKEIKPPVQIARDRIFVRYAEDGGLEKDGCIELRPGVEDINLMDTRYAQVRIGVEGDMYMKGMAVYSSKVPDGYDIVYNVNKHVGATDKEVFKSMKSEGDPFGAITKTKGVDPETGDIVYQKDYLGKDGKMHQSALNIVNDQGSWEDWSKTLASQFLSKQPPELAKRQLDLAAKARRDELDEIESLTNPTIKKKLLEEYADSCDSDAVHLKAAALPRQKTQVIIPIPSLKDDEIYAPNFENGETVVLIRYPHAGRFEIPVLKVNNKNKEGIEVIGKSSKKFDLDAVGINSTVAQQLSGADFDGDNVIVIPNNKGEIKVSAPLAALKNFNMEAYTLPEDSPERKKSEAQRVKVKNMEMGKVSNLITDMTIQGATEEEIARAVKHSMIVIDSVKHNYDWKQSEKDNRIQELRDKYQPKDDPTKPGGGAATLISRAKSQERVTKRTEAYSTRDLTEEEAAAWRAGKKVYKEAKDAHYDEWKVVGKDSSGEPIFEKTGKIKTRQIKSTKMAEVEDARSLSSGTRIEEVYADYANTMKSYANEARAVARSTGRLEKSPSAAKVYANEVESLKDKLNKSEMNRPIERQAQLIAGSIMAAKVRSNPELESDKDAYKKANNKALLEARTRVGANKGAVSVKITDKEWEAIQAGAISDSMLQRILTNTDTEAIKQRATPRKDKGLSDAQITRIKTMTANGLTQAEIANALGVSTTTISNAIKQ